jgi:hypothetical protein
LLADRWRAVLTAAAACCARGRRLLGACVSDGRCPLPPFPRRCVQKFYVKGSVEERIMEVVKSR